MTTVNLAPYLRSAILGNTAITTKLTNWQGSPAVFTRQPIPEDAQFPCVVIPFDAVNTNIDALKSRRNYIVRDVMVYGNVAAPGSPDDDTRTVESIAYELHALFHRNRASLGNTPFHVIDIVVSGPRSAPVDDEKTVGRMITLTVRIQNGS